jgi:hypothetical protein
MRSVNTEFVGTHRAKEPLIREAAGVGLTYLIKKLINIFHYDNFFERIFTYVTSCELTSILQ